MNPTTPLNLGLAAAMSLFAGGAAAAEPPSADEPNRPPPTRCGASSRSNRNRSKR